MFRRIFTLMLAVQIFAFGSIQVIAQEGMDLPITQTQQSTTESIQENSEQTQSTDATVNQNQTTKTDAHDSVSQGQAVDGVVAQEQTPDTDDEIKQHQKSNVTAVQGQVITNTDSLEAEQDQKASMNSSQSQQVSTSANPKNQDQQTSVTTDQEQVLSIEGNTSLAGQVQYTNIETNQQSEMNEDDDGDDLGLKTKVEAKQEQALITSGTGKTNQTQSVEASGEINANGNETVFSLKVLVENGLEIIKRGADTFIKVIQRIDINEDTIEIVENEFMLENSLNGQVQEYTNKYDWGTLYIFNKAIASIMNDDIQTFMESIISFDFVLGKPINEEEYNDEEDNGNEDNNGNGEDTGNGNEDNNGNGNEEGNGNEDNNGNGNEEENGHSNEDNNGSNNENNSGNEENNGNNNEIENGSSNEDNNGSNNEEDNGNSNEENNANNNEEDNGNSNEEDDATNNEEDHGNSDDDGKANNNEVDNGNSNEENNGSNNEEDHGNSDNDGNANNNDDNNAISNEETNGSGIKENKVNSHGTNKRNYNKNYIGNKKFSILWELDSDNDGISDFLEIVKFKTDPFNADTDGDGLTDLYEVIYHDADEKPNFDIMNLTKQERMIYLSKMEYSPKDLNPLLKDTNQNGINDGEEDFDQDGILNACDLNPYDGLSKYFSDWLNDESEQALFFQTQQKYCASQLNNS